MRRLVTTLVFLLCFDVASAEKIRGIAYAHSLKKDRGYGSSASTQSLRKVKSLGANWVSVTPFAFQRQSSDTELRWFRSGAQGIGETDERVRGAIRQAHSLKLRVLMKPHVWLRPPAWPGSIEHVAEADAKKWFASYREFILHYARMSAEEKVEGLSIGNELQRTSHRSDEWRALIREVRKVYRGTLIYGANWEEVEKVTFWDALDAIGVSAYFPLVDKKSATAAEIEAGWRPIAARMSVLSKRFKRKVIFTEIGYRSAEFAAWRQWEIGKGAAVDLEAQAAAYEGFFRSVWNAPWLRGAFLWKWESYPDHGSRSDNEYAIDGKPAEEIVRKHFRRAGS